MRGAGMDGRRMMKFAIGMLALVAAGPALAATCPAAAPFAGWEAAAGGAGEIRVDRATTITLAPDAGLRFPVAPGKATTGGNGAILPFAVVTPGRYRIGAGAGVWIDVVTAGKALPSVAHGHGPECGPVRKIVDFDLAAGRYVLQLSGSKDATVTVMVARGG